MIKGTNPNQLGIGFFPTSMNIKKGRMTKVVKIDIFNSEEFRITTAVVCPSPD